MLELWLARIGGPGTMPGSGTGAS